MGNWYSRDIRRVTPSGNAFEMTSAPQPTTTARNRDSFSNQAESASNPAQPEAPLPVSSHNRALSRTPVITLRRGDTETSQPVGSASRNRSAFPPRVVHTLTLTEVRAALASIKRADPAMVLSCDREYPRDGDSLPDPPVGAEEEAIEPTSAEEARIEARPVESESRPETPLCTGAPVSQSPSISPSPPSSFLPSYPVHDAVDHVLDAYLMKVTPRPVMSEESIHLSHSSKAASPIPRGDLDPSPSPSLHASPSRNLPPEGISHSVAKATPK